MQVRHKLKQFLLFICLFLFLLFVVGGGVSKKSDRFLPHLSTTVPVVPAELLTPEGDLQSLPQRDGIDGAYAARLARTR